MIKKILLSAGLSLLIFELMNYITYKRQNRVLLNINKNILQSAMMFFSDKQIQESEIGKFKDFVLSRLSEQKLDNWITNFKVQLVEDKLSISYGFRRSEEIQDISYEIKRNTHISEKASSNDTKESIPEEK